MELTVDQYSTLSPSSRAAVDQWLEEHELLTKGVTHLEIKGNEAIVTVLAPDADGHIQTREVGVKDGVAIYDVVTQVITVPVQASFPIL